MMKRAAARVRRRTVLVLAMAALVLVGSAALVRCGSDAPSPAGSNAGAHPADTDASKGLYLSLGDSLGQGYQPTVDGVKPDFRKGFAYLVPERAEARGYDLELVNLSCGGITVGSMAGQAGCIEPARAPGGPVYTGTQLRAAVDYLDDHEGEVEVITISIGGNDLISCATDDRDLIECVTERVRRIEAKLEVVLPKLRAAAGPDTVIIGLTYPEMILGASLADLLASNDLATRSSLAFKEIINPMLEEQYEAVDGIFVDVTAAMGAYIPLTETTVVEPYGEVPKALVDICELTWFCERRDIHPRDAGHERIADLVVAALPER